MGNGVRTPNPSVRSRTYGPFGMTAVEGHDVVVTSLRTRWPWHGNLPLPGGEFKLFPVIVLQRPTEQGACRDVQRAKTPAGGCLSFLNKDEVGPCEA